MIQRTFLHVFFVLSVVFVTACGGGGNKTVEAINVEDVGVSILSRLENGFSIAWETSETIESYDIYIALDSSLTSENYASLPEGQVFRDVSSPFQLSNLQKDKSYHVLIHGKNSKSQVIEEGKAIVNTLNTSGAASVSVQDVELPSETEFFIATPRSSDAFESVAGSKTINIDPDVAELVGITDEFGTPYLMARKIAGQSDVEINLDSTAEVFVLMRTRFYGLEIEDEASLSSSIRSHERFNELKNELAERIKISPCPLNSGCSLIAANIADDIANDLNLTNIAK